MKFRTTGIVADERRARIRAFRLVWVGCLLVSALWVVGQESASAAAPLRWKFKAGEVVRYVMTQKTTNSSKPTGGKGASVTMSQTVDLHWTVKSVSPEGLAEMTQTIDRVRAKIEGENQTPPFEFDSADEKPNDVGPFAAQLVPLLKALVGAEFAFKMNAKGELSDITISDKLMETLRQANPGEGNAGFSDDGVKNLISQSTLLLPGADAEAGATWTQQTTVPLPMLGTMVMDKTYQYKGAETPEASSPLQKISMETKVTLKPAPEAVFEIKINDQKGEGAFTFDSEKGRVVASQVHDSLTMALSAMGQQIEQTTTTVTEMKLAPEPAPQ